MPWNSKQSLRSKNLIYLFIYLLISILFLGYSLINRITFNERFGNLDSSNAASSSHASAMNLSLSPSSILQYTSSVISGGQTNEGNITSYSNANISAMRDNLHGQDDSTEKKVALVVVIGGISYLELSAIRFLSASPSFPYKIIVATTKVTNGSKLLQSLN